MLRINQLQLKPGHSEEALRQLILKKLKINEGELLDWSIHKQSVDARKKPEVFYSYSVNVQVKQEGKLLKRLKNKVQQVSEKPYRAPGHGQEALFRSPVIAGAGPAGLFCAYLLASEGYRPILAERGAPVEERMQDVERFWESGVLNPASNVQFGEGGAGTFSDGKLNTLVHDKLGRNRFVLETFVKFGAPESILYEQKPHIGTDILAEVVRNMRNAILSLGGEIRFHCQITDIFMEEVSGSKEAVRENPEGLSGHAGEVSARRVLKAVELNHGERLETDVLILAVGHSARDTFQMLYDKAVPMQAKSFAVGVRIEHPQQMIQNAQYGAEMAEKLPAAAYKLAENLDNGRGVYTFCMCPGGYVVNASSEEGRLAVNGMSYHDRGGENANSAVIVTVTPEDYGEKHPLAGIRFQRQLEEKAYAAGQGCVPVQCYGDFCAGRATRALGDVKPRIKGAYRLADVSSIFPEELAESLAEGIRRMDLRIPGFGRADAVLSGVESRTSSPVKIFRGENLECSIGGIYPCGEGAGYAGGITSAAMDGMKVAEAVITRYGTTQQRRLSQGTEMKQQREF